MKLKLLLLAFIFALNPICALAQEEVDVMFYDNFDYYKSGIPSGWSMALPECVEPYISKDSQGRCAKVISTQNLYDAALCRYFSTPLSSGTVYAHMKIKTPDVTYKRSLFAFRDSANRENQALIFGSNGYIQTPGGKDIMMYKPNKWYDLLVKFNLDEKKYSVWADGKEILSDSAFASAEVANIYFFKFCQLERYNSYCYMDDMYAYKADEEISEEKIRALYFFSYKDISSSWARREIEDFAANHIIQATEDGNFRPNGNVTREEFAIWFRGALGIPEYNYSGMCDDVLAGDNAAGSIAALVETGTNGPYPGKWNPQNEVTVKEALEMLIEGYKYYKHSLPGEEQKAFKSWQEKGEWSRNYEAQADAINLFENVIGIDCAAGNSDKILTRAQAVKMLTNYQKIISE